LRRRASPSDDADGERGPDFVFRYIRRRYWLRAEACKLIRVVDTLPRVERKNKYQISISYQGFTLLSLAISIDDQPRWQQGSGKGLAVPVHGVPMV
jgi:hypothetical protein